MFDDSSKMIIVDLYSGSYTKDKKGHEYFNFEKSIDDKYRGYIPFSDGAKIDRFGATKRDEYSDGILVVYTKKIEGISDREIIGFHSDARVYRRGQSGENKNRNFLDNDNQYKTASYSIESDFIYDLRDNPNKFVININNYNRYMFRSQRFYGGKYPELDKKIVNYIKKIITQSSSLDSDFDEQEIIQNINPASKKELMNSSNRKLDIITSSNGSQVRKRQQFSKNALIMANYECQIDKSHITFNTSQNKPYMEGHHLIPCTPNKAQLIMDRFSKNIDCVENIVSLCPICHRAIHFGNVEKKIELIHKLYYIQQEKLRNIGINITEQELIDFYLKDEEYIVNYWNEKPNVDE